MDEEYVAFNDGKSSTKKKLRNLNTPLGLPSKRASRSFCEVTFIIETNQFGSDNIFCGTRKRKITSESLAISLRDTFSQVDLERSEPETGQVSGSGSLDQV